MRFSLAESHVEPKPNSAQLIVVSKTAVSTKVELSVEGNSIWVELGLKYYVLSKTYILARLDYQWFFEDSEDIDDTFDDGAWQNTVGIGFNF